MTDRYPPPAEFVRTALITDDTMHAEGERDREGFWAGQAEQLDWFRPFERVFEGDLASARWFVGGELNASYNCLDRHVEAGLGDRVAYHWEGEPSGDGRAGGDHDRRTITYAELLDEVQRVAATLRDLGVERGDRVAIYLPMIPELPVTMLACARLGAAHSVVFGGFSASSLRDRIEDAGCRVLVTADGGFRRGSVVPLKASADEALAGDTPIEHVIVVRRTGAEVAMQEGRDRWYHEAVPAEPVEVPAVPVDSEQLLYLLYTSGTTAKPKGIMHTTAGYLTHVMATTRWTFDLRSERDVFWCAADIGWVTGHSYIVYGPLANAATQVLFEGTPDHPDRDRFWEVVERYGVTILYTAPTAIRSFMKWGREHVDKHDVSSLRLLGTVGEPINPAAWEWYRDVVGGGRCPIVDTWWQTETGGQMMTPLPGLHAAKPGCAMQPLPGIGVEVVDERGQPLAAPGDGYLTIEHPWPGMLRGIWGDPQRFHDTYFSRFEGRYFAGDGARLDEDGDIWILGRVDDVMNIAGHRISTAEVESALVSHELVAEAAVVARSDATSGQAIAAFVTLRGSADGDDELEQTLRDHVAKVLGPIARPKTVLFTPDLPKTRSGKIMRRLLRDIAEGRDLGDTTTLANAEMVIDLSERAAAAR